MTLCIQLLSLLAVQLLDFTDGKAIEVLSLEAKEDLANEVLLGKREIEDNDNEVEMDQEVEERELGHKVAMREDDLDDFEWAAEEETVKKRDDHDRQKSIQYEYTKVEDLDARKSRKNPFKLVDEEGRGVRGENEGLLLYMNGTVCTNLFNHLAADAICRFMGYGKAHPEEGVRYGTQPDGRNSTIGDVHCDARRWKSTCTFKTRHNCPRKQVIFLKCTRRKGGGL